MTETTMLLRAADRVRDWLETAYTFWVARGIDDDGMFYEQIDFDGSPDAAAPRRMRVQARQLYVFARALQAGHEAARPALRRGLACFERRCWSEDGGWIHLLDAQGRPANGLRDTYDQAFALFGLAALHQAGLAEARAGADRTLGFLDRLSSPQGGYDEGLPASLPRRSNPHMHLMEAMLAWHALTGEAHFLQRADAIACLFTDHFFDRSTHTLGEHFDQALQPLPAPLGTSVEPGHHLEWSWLLHRLAAHGGRDHRADAAGLHDWAMRHGLDGAGFAIDECDKDGSWRRAGRRAWPQTELIKSLLANGDTERAGTAAIAFLDSYLATDIPGLWIDRFDEAGRPDAATVPASTLYHIVVAFEELLRVAGG